MIGPDESLGIMPCTGTYYHLVKRVDPLDPMDFRSQVQQGRSPRGPRARDPKYLRQWNGVSVHDTLEQSRHHAEYFAWKIGDIIAQLVIPEGTEITYERVGDGGHGVLYNTDPVVLVSYVTGAVRARELAEGNEE